MKRLATWVITAGIAALCVLSGCSEDLRIEEQRFKCSGPSDCLAGFECLPIDENKPTLKACQRPGDASDADDVRPDRDTTDAADAPSDITDAGHPDAGHPDADTSPADVPDVEICDNGTDDDNNGASDCDDPACSSSSSCSSPECTQTSDCGPWHVCDEGECQPKTCSSATDCGENGVCDSQSGTCAEGRLHVHIADDTPTDDSTCDAENYTQPGADLHGATVLDAQGSAIAHGRLIRAELRGQYNNSTESIAEDTFDGARVETNFCPVHEVALGCGGSVYLEFISVDTDQPLRLSELPSGASLKVYEDGDECIYNEEPWKAYLCRFERDDIEGGQNLDCDLLGSETGTAQIDL